MARINITANQAKEKSLKRKNYSEIIKRFRLEISDEISEEITKKSMSAKICLDLNNFDEELKNKIIREILLEIEYKGYTIKEREHIFSAEENIVSKILNYFTFYINWGNAVPYSYSDLLWNGDKTILFAYEARKEVEIIEELNNAADELFRDINSGIEKSLDEDSCVVTFSSKLSDKTLETLFQVVRSELNDAGYKFKIVDNTAKEDLNLKIYEIMINWD